MKCQESKQKIYSLIDKEIPFYEERGLYSHLSNCSKCMEEYNLARDLDDFLKETVTYVDPPDDFSDNVIKLIMEEENTKNHISEKNLGKKKFLKPTFLGKVAGIIFAIFLGINSFGSNIFQVANNPDNKHKLRLPVLSEFKIDKEQNSSKINDKTNKAKDLKDNQGMVADKYNQDKKEGLPSGEDSKTTSDGINTTKVPNQNTGIKEPEKSGSKVVEPDKKDSILEPQNGLPVPEGQITIASKNNSAYRINVDKLSFSDAGKVSNPYWSENKEKIYFTIKNENGYSWHEAYLGNKNTNKILGPISSPGVFSPVLKKVAFTSQNNVWILDSYGNLKNISANEEGIPSGKRSGFDPIWSAKGELAYLTERFGGIDIMIYDTSGKNRRLTFSSENEKYPAWSPNGNKIAYYRSHIEKESGKQIGQVFVQNMDGSGLKAVTPKVYSNKMVPSWSPDGKLLAINISGDTSGILEANVDTGDSRLLFEKGGGNEISWSPNGQSIAFNDNSGKMYILKRNQMRKLVTEIPYVLKQDVSISWSPDGGEILFDMLDPETSKNELWIAKLPKSIIDY